MHAMISRAFLTKGVEMDPEVPLGPLPGDFGARLN